MNKVADDVWQIPLTPRNGVNAYLAAHRGKLPVEELPQLGLTAHERRHLFQSAGLFEKLSGGGDA